MAIRSNAGTGVIVSLVVFILISVFLLVVSVLFYTGKTSQIENVQKMTEQLDEFARKNERNSEQFQTIKAAADKERKSVLGYVMDEHNALKAWVDGNPDASIASIKQRFSGVDNGMTLYNTVKDLERKVADTRNELDSLQDRVSALQAERDNLTSELETASRSRDTLLAAESKQLETYRTATDEHLAEIADVRQMMETSRDKLRDRYTDDISNLNGDVADLRQEKLQLKSKLDELSEIIDETRVKPKDPATLVDGTVIDIAGSNDQVYIDRGRQDRIVLGMKFEVYGDAAQIRPDENGDFPRGKASLQVIKVGDSTSTAKITRTTRGRPVVREDVIANAIYSPDYQFKFLVHGQFDIDGDSDATEQEAAFLRSQIESWGGEVVQGETLPADLDFLVLGLTPTKPMPMQQDASLQLKQEYFKKRLIYDTYQSLYNQALDAQIPVLNANRLQILTGDTGL